MTARLSRNLDGSNCLQWAELSGRLWAVNRGDHALRGKYWTPLSLCCHPCYFKTSLNHGVKTDDTTLDSESIIRPIYQLGSLYTINKHIAALPCSAPRDTISTSSPTQRNTSIRDLCCTVALFVCHGA